MSRLLERGRARQASLLFDPYVVRAAGAHGHVDDARRCLETLMYSAHAVGDVDVCTAALEAMDRMLGENKVASARARCTHISTLARAGKTDDARRALSELFTSIESAPPSAMPPPGVLAIAVCGLSSACRKRGDFDGSLQALKWADKVPVTHFTACKLATERLLVAACFYNNEEMEVSRTLRRAANVPPPRDLATNAPDPSRRRTPMALRVDAVWSDHAQPLLYDGYGDDAASRADACSSSLLASAYARALGKANDVRGGVHALAAIALPVLQRARNANANETAARAARAPPEVEESATMALNVVLESALLRGDSTRDVVLGCRVLDELATGAPTGFQQNVRTEMVGKRLRARRKKLGKGVDDARDPIPHPATAAESIVRSHASLPRGEERSLEFLRNRSVRLLTSASRKVPGQTSDILLHAGDVPYASDQNREKMAEREWAALARYHAMRYAAGDDIPRGSVPRPPSKDAVSTASRDLAASRANLGYGPSGDADSALTLHAYVHALGTVAAFDEVVATLADAPTNAFASRVWHAALSTARRWARPDVSRRVLKLMAERDEIPNALHHATHLGALARKGLHGDVEEYYNSLPHPIKQDADVATVMSRSRDDSGLVL